MINDFLSILLKFRHFALAGLCLVLATQAVAAADARTPDVIGTYGNWNALSFTDNGGGKVCFMASLPKQQIGVSGKKRGKVQFFITHWAADKTRNTVSVSAGYAYKSGSKVTVSVDGKSYTLLTDGETAWAQDQATDNTITAAIRDGTTLTVKGTSARGTRTTDIYSLKGSGAAHDAITKACGL